MKKAPTLVWTLHYGAPAQGEVMGPARRYGKVRIATPRGEAHVLVEHQAYAAELYPTEASAKRARRRENKESAAKRVHAARVSVSYARKQERESARYHRKDVATRIRALAKAQREHRKASK